MHADQTKHTFIHKNNVVDFLLKTGKLNLGSTDAKVISNGLTTRSSGESEVFYYYGRVFASKLPLHYSITRDQLKTNWRIARS